LADRVTSVVVPVVLAVVNIIPWWLVVALLVRDVVVFLALAQLRRTGQLGLPVTFIGKAATFALLMGFPFLLLGGEPGGAAQWSTVVGWLFTVIGLGLYWWSAVVYLGQVRSLTRSNS
jgi:cardiolipin synthase